MSERLHKFLAQHGLGSRREIERWILEGRVQLNRKPAQLGDRYSPGDRVAIDGKDVSSRLRAAAAPQALLYHKPQGQPIVAGVNEADSDPDSKSVMESLPSLRGVRWLLVNTMHAGDSGLLLVTSDGALADALRRRAESTPSEYVARVLIPYVDFDMTSIPRFVQYDEETVEFESVEPVGGEGTNRWFSVKSHRAHRRAAVRALFESRGLKVSRVTQVKFADLELPRDLPRGRHRELTPAQLAALYTRAGLTNPNAPKPAGDRGRPANRGKPRTRRAVASDRRGGPRSSRPTGSPKSSR